ncbi:MAG: hypothetical protein J2P19_23970 [Pseudonocardia sp.]|nr:hypothetical protein [Pseudonocardia sp.]
MRAPRVSPRPDFSVDLSAQVPRHERFDYWQDVICDVFVKLDARRVGPADEFTGSLRSVRAGEVRLSRMRVSGHEVIRSTGGIARSDAHDHLINMPLDGRCDLLVQDGRTTMLNPGDFALSDTARPYRLRFRDPFDMFVLHVPDQLLAALVPGMRDLTATAVRADSPTGSLLRQLLTRIDTRAGSELAARNGFKDASHFTRVFTKRYGQSPRAHRRSGCSSPCAAIENRDGP